MEVTRHGAALVVLHRLILNNCLSIGTMRVALVLALVQYGHFNNVRAVAVVNFEGKRQLTVVVVASVLPPHKRHQLLLVDT